MVKNNNLFFVQIYFSMNNTDNKHIFDYARYMEPIRNEYKENMPISSPLEIDNESTFYYDSEHMIYDKMSYFEVSNLDENLRTLIYFDESIVNKNISLIEMFDIVVNFYKEHPYKKDDYEIYRQVPYFSIFYKCLDNENREFKPLFKQNIFTKKEISYIEDKIKELIMNDETNIKEFLIYEQSQTIPSIFMILFNTYTYYHFENIIIQIKNFYGDKLTNKNRVHYEDE